MRYLKFLLIGMFFGIVLTKAEVISWFRIQEMFRFQSFHMYGIIGSAVAVGMLSVWLIRKFNIKTIQGEPIKIEPKKYHKGYFPGGLIFGLGWALTGACPGPLFALIGNGFTVMAAALAAAVMGTYTYGLVKNKLLH
ncbi:MAG TPA: DUF6691 family protein [Cytophagaceae bacterium]|nr:DUF6691 family protein [Cytophagaceae bacterium]